MSKNASLPTHNTKDTANIQHPKEALLLFVTFGAFRCDKLQ